MTQCFDAVTNRASLDYYIMPYGKHRGKFIYTIYKKYPDYFAWMLDNSSDEIKEVLLHILDKFAFITIKEICEKAGVNRSTFYLHYETINDLLSETIEYIGKKIHKKFNNKVLDKQTIKNSKLEDLFLITPEYILPYLEFLKENKAIYKIAYSQPFFLRSLSNLSI